MCFILMFPLPWTASLSGDVVDSGVAARSIFDKAVSLSIALGSMFVEVVENGVCTVCRVDARWIILRPVAPLAPNSAKFVAAFVWIFTADVVCGEAYTTDTGE